MNRVVAFGLAEPHIEGGRKGMIPFRVACPRSGSMNVAASPALLV
jgi:hypothetical protein